MVANDVERQNIFWLAKMYSGEKNDNIRLKRLKQIISTYSRQKQEIADAVEGAKRDSKTIGDSIILARFTKKTEWGKKKLCI
ncbi:MAG: hypothetical protein Ta2E_09060 [Mycoplasmoidaceae bacterium]|nr:MAG: hypothetical protein Ta2E_09060 [Mycoplasmoidaceae bacterium]